MSTIDSNAYVSEFTKKTLAQFGWVVGEPIPVTLGDLLANIRERIAPSKVPGLLVNIADMTDDDIAAVKAALAGVKTAIAEEAKRQEMDRKTAGLSESARQVYEQIAAREDQTPSIIDDRVPAEPAAPVPAAAPVAEKPEEVEKPIDVKNPITEPPIVALSDSAQTPPFCPRCSWDMRRDFDVTVTETDKEDFLAITLGDARMKKTYTLMGGKYEIRFRTLRAEENNTIHHQVLLDQNAGHFLSDTEWYLRLFEYRLAASVESITVNNKLAATVPELCAITPDTQLPYALDDASNAAIVRLRAYVLAGTIKNEVTRRLVVNQFRAFQRFYETLEAMALEPNFW